MNPSQKAAPNQHDSIEIARKKARRYGFLALIFALPYVVLTVTGIVLEASGADSSNRVLQLVYALNGPTFLLPFFFTFFLGAYLHYLHQYRNVSKNANSALQPLVKSAPIFIVLYMTLFVLFWALTILFELNNQDGESGRGDLTFVALLLGLPAAIASSVISAAFLNLQLAWKTLPLLIVPIISFTGVALFVMLLVAGFTI